VNHPVTSILRFFFHVVGGNFQITTFFDGNRFIRYDCYELFEYDLRIVFYGIIVLLLLSFVQPYLLVFNETNRLDHIYYNVQNKLWTRSTNDLLLPDTHTQTNIFPSVRLYISYNIIKYVQFMVISILYYNIIYVMHYNATTVVAHECEHWAEYIPNYNLKMYSVRVYCKHVCGVRIGRLAYICPSPKTYNRRRKKPTITIRTWVLYYYTLAYTVVPYKTP